MNEELKQIKNKELGKLPREHREAVESLDWAAITEQIGKKHLLIEEEIESLQAEVLIGLLGFTHTDGFITNIEDNVGVTKEEAGKLAEELGKQIFYPVILQIEQNIKNNARNKETALNQNLDFILSGGDYWSFMKKPQALEQTPLNTSKESIQNNLEKTLGTKSKFTI